VVKVGPQLILRSPILHYVVMTPVLQLWHLFKVPSAVHRIRLTCLEHLHFSAFTTDNDTVCYDCNRIVST